MFGGGGGGGGGSGGLEAKLGQVEAEAEAAMREDMSRLGLEPDEVTGDCPIDSKGESVVRCGEYLEGLRSEVGVVHQPQQQQHQTTNSD